MSIRKFTPHIASLFFFMFFMTACGNEAMEKNATLLQQALPEALTVVETSPKLLARDCPNGGMRVTHGLDHNRDGQLNPYERLNFELICSPGALPFDPSRGVAIITGE